MKRKRPSLKNQKKHIKLPKTQANKMISGDVNGICNETQMVWSCCFHSITPGT